MTRSISFKLEGFTPIIDELVDEVGLVTAAVYGVVWRYCQMREGRCRASLDTLSGRLGLSSRTVLRHIKVLCDRGYLEDRTPGLRNRPHIYRDTGKLGVQGTIRAGLMLPQVTESHSTVTESQSGHDRESHEDTKETKEETTTIPATPDVPSPTAKAYNAFEAWCTALDIDPERVTKGKRGQELRFGKELLDAGWTLAQIEACTRSISRQPFWKGRTLSLATIAKQINQWSKANGNGNGADRHIISSRSPLLEGRV